MKRQRKECAAWIRYTLFTVLLLGLLGVSTAYAMPIGTKIGVVLSTDILATIDQQPIPSMNINGYTAIVVEDLRSYGFNVYWSETERTLRVSRNPNLTIQPMPVKASSLEPGTVLKPVLFTDIKTYLDDREIVSFNINGQTAMYFNQLRPFGELIWHEETRTAAFTYSEPEIREEPALPSVTRRSTQLDPEENYLPLQPLDRSEIANFINVGLFFGESAVTRINLASGDGFVIGEFHKDNYQSLIQLKETYQLTLAADDSQYAGLNRLLSSAAEAQQLIAEFQHTDYSVVPVREPGGWNVYVGPVLSQRDFLAASNMNLPNHLSWALTTNGGNRIRLEDSMGRPVIIFHSETPLYISSLTDDPYKSVLQVGNQKYRGTVTAFRNSGQWLTVVNRLPVEQYLYGVVPREMPHSWHPEALKAQAVAARGFAIANIGRFRHLGFDVCTTVNSQVYGGYSSEQRATSLAVDQTRGKIMTSGGKLVIPYYHSNSGGQTESTEFVWNEAVPYARGVYDPFSLHAPHGQWVVTLSFQEIEQMMSQSQREVGSVTDLMINEVSPNGRVLSMTVFGSRGTQTLKKQENRWVFNLRSNFYNIRVGVQSVDFMGRGFGHGVGMSQHGARVMAEEGYSWQQILAHYYTGIQIE